MKRNRIDSIFMRKLICDTAPEAEDGGKGSGNWGHLGRAGKRGGSGKGTGGHEYRSGSKESGYSRNEEARQSRTITSKLTEAKSKGQFPGSIVGNPQQQAIALKAINKVYGKTPESVLKSFGKNAKLSVNGDYINLVTNNGMKRSHIPSGFENDPEVVEGAKTMLLMNAYKEQNGKFPDMGNSEY